VTGETGERAWMKIQSYFSLLVMDTCLNWALAHEDSGVWGGMSEDERRALKRRIARNRNLGNRAVGY
jgi:hypothetical protein